MPRSRTLDRKASASASHTGDTTGFDRLEPRTVLASTEVAAVGLAYELPTSNDGLDVGTPITRAYAMHGNVSEGDTLSYRLRWAGATGPTALTPTRTAAIRLGDGTFDYENARWPGLANETGSQFLPRDGYTMGWWSAFTEAYLGNDRSPSTTHSEQQLIVPLADSTTPLSEV